MECKVVRKRTALAETNDHLRARLEILESILIRLVEQPQDDLAFMQARHAGLCIKLETAGVRQ